MVTNATFESSSISSGTPVSFNQQGSLQIGGGTTIYKNSTSFFEACTKYTKINAVFDNIYVYSSSNSNGGTLFKVIQVGSSPTNTKVISSTFISAYEFYEIITLSQTQGLLVGVTQDSSVTNSTAFLVALKVNPTTYAIEYGSSVLYSSSEFSEGPQLSRLYETSFSMIYYLTDSIKVATRYGIFIISTV